MSAVKRFGVTCSAPHDAGDELIIHCVYDVLPSTVLPLQLALLQPALLLLSLARSLSISRNKSSSLCLKCLLNPCRLHVPFPIIPLHMLLLLLLPCCPVVLLRSIPFRFMPVRSFRLSRCHFVNWANICTTLLSALQMDCPSDRSFLASPRLLRAVYTGKYI